MRTPRHPFYPSGLLRVLELGIALTLGVGCGGGRGPAFPSGDAGPPRGNVFPGDAGPAQDAGNPPVGDENDASIQDSGDATEDAASEPPLVVSNQADFGALRETGLVLGPPNGTFDTDSECTLDAPLGECTPVSLTRDRVDACVCRADEMVIGDLRIVGSRALVLLAWRSIEVIERLDVGGGQGVHGPGAFTAFEDAVASNQGGEGGGYGTDGGGAPVTHYGTERLTPLLGGMDGRDGCGGAVGGGGGGAVQLSAGQGVLVTGVVNAGGGGGSAGRRGSSCNGGGGGGSGGAILIEAPRVEMRGALAANGGGGGSGGSTDWQGNPGQDAASTLVAAGGESQRDATCVLYPDVYSGRGGNGATFDSPAEIGGDPDWETRCLGDTYAGGGGGGGGLGRIRINSTAGARSCICSGDFSPLPTFGELLQP